MCLEVRWGRVLLLMLLLGGFEWDGMGERERGRRETLRQEEDG